MTTYIMAMILAGCLNSPDQATCDYTGAPLCALVQWAPHLVFNTDGTGLGFDPQEVACDLTEAQDDFSHALYVLHGGE